MKYKPLDLYLAYQLSKEGVGSVRAKEIYKRVGKEKELPVPKSFEDLLEDINLLPFYSNQYPYLLKQTVDHPAMLFGKGEIGLLGLKLVTIVGTRKMSDYGRRVVEELISTFPKDLAVVSGLALGVDGAVHRACLKHGVPTIAVVGGGIDVGYPSAHKGLYKEIVKYGLILSEFPPGRNLGKSMFPIRNRIMAGLSGATIVIESAKRGGSFITALQALEYNRVVGAVPGSVFSEVSEGANTLIKMGAEVVRSREDILSLV